MTPAEYKSNMTDAILHVTAMYPDAHIAVLPVLTASNSFNIRPPCYFPSSNYQNVRGPLNEEEGIIVHFNEIIRRINEDNNLMSLMQAYTMCSALNCEKRKRDPVHWVQCQGVSTPLYSEVVKLYLQNICLMRKYLRRRRFDREVNQLVLVV